MIAIRAMPKMRSLERIPVVPFAAVFAAVLLTTGDALADQPLPRAMHITDSTSDRAPTKTTFPSYPRIAQRDRIEGEATVCFKIDKHGKIRGARLRDASHRIFRRPALRAIRLSEFEALAPHEVLATARSCRTYLFRLEPILVASDED
jgi:TonB family protein